MSPELLADGNSPPTVGRLIRNAFGFIMARFDLLILMVSPLLFFVFAQSDGMFLDSRVSSYDTIFPVFFLVCLLLYLLVTSTAIYIIAKSPTERVSLGAGLAWAGKNLFSVGWIFILVAFTVIGCFAFPLLTLTATFLEFSVLSAFFWSVSIYSFPLFIIPGVILFINLSLSHLAYVEEGKRGVSALIRSRDLVEGKWWKVFMVVILATISAFILFSLVNYIVSFVNLDYATSEALEVVIIQVFAVLLQLLIFHISMQLFFYLRSVRPSALPNELKVRRGKYIVLAWLGVISLTSFITAFSLFLHVVFA